MDQSEHNQTERIEATPAAPTHGRLSRGAKPLIWLSVIALAVMGVYGATLFNIVDKSAETATLLEELGGEAEKEQAYRATRHALAETKAIRDGLQERFVVESGVAPFLQEIEALARRAGTTLTFEHVTIERSGGATPFLQMQFKVYGEFGSMYYFLALIETFPYNISLEQFVLRHNGSDLIEDGAQTGPWEGLFITNVKSFIETDDN
ncbi:MAG: hypothetical protein HY457_01435 [Parcubacteria group bacterium]|nr:hypothetical protein [Parcubacteria group bacterium]